MNEITGLPVFVQVAEMQSFVAAGRILGISARSSTAARAACG